MTDWPEAGQELRNGEVAYCAEKEEKIDPEPNYHRHIDCSLPGSSVHGIFQAIVQEWGAIAFSTSFIIVVL